MYRRTIFTDAEKLHMMTDERCTIANNCAKLSINSVSIEIDGPGLRLRSQNKPKEGEGGWWGGAKLKYIIQT